MTGGALRDMQLDLHGLVAKVVAPRAIETDREARWPEEQLRALLREGYGGLVVPETAGGRGQGLSGLLMACETIGSACASTAMCFGMHAVASAVIAAKATPRQRDDLLMPIARGEHLTSLALSEPGTGSIFYVPETRVAAMGDAYVLEGAKSFVTNGGHADSYVISAAHADATPGQFSCLVVEEGAQGLAWDAPWAGIGMRGNSSRTARLLGVRVPRDRLLGAEGDQAWYVFHVVAPYFLIAMSGTYIGVARAALVGAIERLKMRIHTHTGRPLAQNGIVQHRIGTLWADVEKARQLARHAAAEADALGPDAMPALLSAKAEVAEMAVRVTNECLTVMGGAGYAQEGGLDRHLRDARAAPVMAPTTDLLRSWTGRWLLGEPILSD